MGHIIKVRRGMKATIPSSAGAGEPLYTMDTKEFFVGNGDGQPLSPIGGTKVGSTGSQDYLNEDYFEQDTTNHIRLKLNTLLADVDVDLLDGHHASDFATSGHTHTGTYEPVLTKGNLTESTSSVLTVTGGTGAVIGSGATIQVKQASTSQSGYLSSTDWNTFNGKQNALGYTPENVANKGSASGYAGLDSTGKLAQNVDAGKITTGTIDIARLPVGALERLFIVDDQVARYALQPEVVQNGDTVKQTDTGVMYYVKDNTNLGNANGYEIYAAGTAAAIEWAGILNKPDTLSGYGITDAVNSSEVVTTATANKILKLNGSAKLPASITGDADTVDGKHAGTTADTLLILGTGGFVPLGNIPATLTGKDADTVDGKHANDFALSGHNHSGVYEPVLTKGNIGETTSSVLTVTGGTGAVIGSGVTIQVKQAGGLQDGYLTSTDWNTFNNKQDALGYTPVPPTRTVNGHSLSADVTITTTDIGAEPTLTKGTLQEASSSVLTITGGTNAVIGSGTTIQVKAAGSSQSGYLSSGDWNTFNNKLNASAYTANDVLAKIITVDGNGSALDADLLDGLHAGNSTGAIPISNGSLNINLNADMLDGYHAGSSAGQIPVSDGGLNTNLNADLLDGNHASAFSLTGHTHTGFESTLTKGDLTESTSNILTIVGGTNAVIGTGTSIQVAQANSTQDGFLSSTDWSDFNAKLDASTYTANDILAKLLTVDGPSSLLDADTVDGLTPSNLSGGIALNNGFTNVNLDADMLDGHHATYFATSGHNHSGVYEPVINKGDVSESVSGVLTITGGTDAVIGTGLAIEVKKASSTQDGYLSSTDWSTFNGKQDALGFTPEDVNNKGAVSGYASLDANQKLVQNVDASKITSGTIDIARLPAGALERLVVVADQAARYALTSTNVQNGDTVKQTDTGVMYFVIDGTNLGNASGYSIYTAGSATSVPWSGVSGKPSTLSGFGITDGVTNTTTVNGHALSSNVTVTQSDVGLSDVTNNAQVKKIASSTDHAIIRWNGTTGDLPQDSLVTIDDTGNVNIPTGTKYKINGTNLAATDVGAEPTLTKGNLTETTSSVLTVTGGTGAVIGSGLTIQVKQASGTVSGYLSSTDWSTFNGKQDALGYTPVPNTRTVNGHALSADVTVTKSDVGLGNVTNDAQVKKIASATDHAIVRWSGVTGDLQQDSLSSIDDAGSVNIPTGQKYKINGTALAATDVGAEPTLTKGNLTESTSSVLTITGGSSAIIGSGLTIQVKVATSTQNGYLTSTDWSTFNDKQNALGYTPVPNTRTVNGHALTSDVTVTASDVGLGNVTNNAQVKKITSSTDHAVMRWNSTTGDTPLDSSVTIDDAGSVNIPTGQKYKINGTNLAATDVGAEPILTKGNLTESTSSVLTITGGSSAIIGSGLSIQVKAASGSQSGYLSSTDWTTFNGKQNVLGFTPVPDTRTVNGHALTANVTVTKSDVGLGNVTNDAQVKKIASSTDHAIVRWSGATGDLQQDSLITIDDLGNINIPTGTNYKINGSNLAAVNVGAEPTLTKGNLTESTSSVLTITGGSSAIIGSGLTIQVKQASGSVPGYLSSTDWTTFNGKQNALGYTPVNKAGDSMSGQLTSTVSTGTSPFVVASTTLVSNLNADLHDGYNASGPSTANTIPVRDASGNITAKSFVSDVAQGTAPLTVTSTTKVTNLNVDAVDGCTVNDAGTTTSDLWTASKIQTAINSVLGANDAMVFKGAINCSANPNYPAADAGWTYKVSVAGKIGGASGVNVEIGDTLYCAVDSTASGTQAVVGANWVIVQTNIDGAVVGPASSTDRAVAIYNSTTGKLIQNSLATIDAAGSVNIPSGQKYKINNTNLAATDVGAEPTLTKGNLTEATSSVLTITGGTGAVIGSGLTVQVKQATGSVSGYLSSTDWTTFNSKEPAVTKGNLTESTSSVLTITGGTGAVIGSGLTIQVKQATGSVSGYLSSTDWTTFNSKQSALTLGNVTESTSSVLTITGGTGAVVGSGLGIQVKQATGTVSGYLSSTDWTTFNGKQNALGYTPVNKAGDSMSGVLTSTVVTGTAPFTVASTTAVTNLNADLLDGLHAATASTVSTIAARNASGNIAARSFTSDVVTGTAPFTVASTTVVTNLNADLLDGYTATNASTALTIPIRDGGGRITGKILTSDIAIGTAPLEITSTTKVNNLNVDMVDGLHTATASTVSTIAARDASGNLTAKSLISDVVTGTAPLTVISTTKVNNLNVEKVDSCDVNDAGSDTASLWTASKIIAYIGALKFRTY